jgi:hypothetical protein
MDLREIGLIWLRIGTNGGSCKHGNEDSGSIKCLEIIQWLGDWRLLKEDSTPWS